MKKNTDIAWERWGQQDPYFAVLTEQKYRKVSIESAKASFFESGQLHVADVLRKIEEHFGPVSRGDALDFGCGVGRLSIPLAKEFNRVTGLDVSRAMLEEASKNLAERRIDNVDLVESDDVLSRLGDKRFNFIHTYIVLQHISAKRGYVIVRNLLRHLASGGTFFIHVCCRRNLPLVRELVYFCKTKIPGGYILFNMLQGKKISEPVMEGNEYDVGTLLKVFQEAGFEDVMTKLENRSNCLTASFYSKKD